MVSNPLLGALRSRADDLPVSHICLTLDAAEAELPAICAGELATAPSSGLGSNAAVPEAERRVPRAIVFGAGIPRGAGSARDGRRAGARSRHQAVAVSRQDVLDAAGDGAPGPDVIAKVLREKLAGI